MNKKEESLSSVLNIILLLFFSIITLFTLFFICDIPDQESFIPALIFTIIDLLVIYGIVLGGSRLKSYVGLPFYIATTTITGIYLFIQVIHFFITYQTANVEAFILFRFIVIFIYSSIVFTIIKFGSNH